MKILILPKSKSHGRSSSEDKMDGDYSERVKNFYLNNFLYSFE